MIGPKTVSIEYECCILYRSKCSGILTDGRTEDGGRDLQTDEQTKQKYGQSDRRTEIIQNALFDPEV